MLARIESILVKLFFELNFLSTFVCSIFFSNRFRWTMNTFISDSLCLLCFYLFKHKVDIIVCPHSINFDWFRSQSYFIKFDHRFKFIPDWWMIIRQQWKSLTIQWWNINFHSAQTIKAIIIIIKDCWGDFEQTTD